MLDVDVQPPGDPLAQVAVQRALDLAAQLSCGAPMIRRSNAPRLKSVNSTVARVLEVVVRLLLDAALVARLRPAALVVPAVHVVRRSRSVSSHAVAAADEDARRWRLTSSTQ